ncbi:PREDICTED: hydrolethalus syndrome protein 1 [Poecilia mexicana]|uniref:Centriolar and ciliogenesis-associated protein HYLS1 C-terminal domain-containing protein n=1 Tax=Poecilia mexicana TaxID=48701 RepID=A0A3B3WLQ8_9TELE|nr:PREDICTED: hydrolethalus syndrome protein 1 [Poecilia mexicana]
MVANFLTNLRGEHKIDNIMDNLDFSEEEIQQQLAILGYKTIPKHRLLEFKQDLDELIRHGQWKNLASPRHISIHTRRAASQSSLPAYTKEKVSLSYNNNSGDGFFLHKEVTGRDSTLSNTQKSEHNVRSLSCGDSYAALSVGPRLHFSAGAPNRLQEEPDTEDTLDSLLSDSYTSCSDHQQRRVIKRKVLRKRKGKSFICSESIYTDDSDASSCLEERMAELDLTSDRKDYDTDENDSQGSETDAVDFPAFRSCIDVVTQSDREVRPKPKSFIRPVMFQRAIKKNDPVTRYFQYKEMWDAFQVPGDNVRKALRWQIKEKLSYQPLPKPRRVYVPNTYTVPTQKKRSELRWTIRNDLANRRLPQKFNSQF